MMQWRMKDGCVEKAFKQFFETQGALPEGSKQVGRYHAPGSAKGFLLVETDNLETVYEHCAEWAEYLSWEVTPVVEDDVAGKIGTKVFK